MQWSGDLCMLPDESPLAILHYMCKAYICMYDHVLGTAYLITDPLNTNTLKCDVASHHEGHRRLNIAGR